MSLSCSCGEWDGEGVGYYSPTDFTILEASKRKRCKSCNVLIDIGAECLKFERMRYPTSEIEMRIFNEDYEIFLAPHYFCEDCGCIFMSLDELGFCLGPQDEMAEKLAEYQSEYAHPAWSSFKDKSP